MKLLCVFVAFLALSRAEESTIPESDNHVASAVTSTEVLEEPKEADEEILEPAASAHQYASNTKLWNPQYSVPPQYIFGPSASDYVPPVSDYIPSVGNYVPLASDFVPPVNNYAPPDSNYVPSVSNHFPSASNYVPPVSNYVPPVSNYVPPVNNYVPSQNDYVPPKNNYVPPKNSNYPPHFWNTYFTTWTTPASIIKNEYIHGDNGSYKYEYQITDGTHVGEVGYFTNPHQTDDSLVKKGWYSYVGADGKTYTVHYWADHTGFHVYNPASSQNAYKF